MLLLLLRSSSSSSSSRRLCSQPKSKCQYLQQYQTLRFFVEARVNWVRDRGLDHAVEREKHLKPMLALKDLIKSEPSKSIPISLAAERKTQLFLPTRAADFIRKYPSIFEEFLPPGGTLARPHVRLTPEVLSLDEEEQSIYQRESYREDVANRLLKLIMLTRVNKMPITILERLKWDLGLPPDYARTLVTEFPDYFQISEMKGNEFSSPSPSLALELVCWTDELAVSVMEQKAKKDREVAYKKGLPLAFPLQYSRGFDLEKKVKTWLDEWQKLPYISPYEDASHLQSKSDQAEKWTVAVLHELLYLFISKKTERDNIFCLGEYLGFGSRFKRALVNHPGIFYVSSKLRTHTAVLREAFKRDLLLEKHPLMGMRYQYIHLMNKENDQVKPIGLTNTNSTKKQSPRTDEGGETEAEAEAVNDDDYDNDSEDEDENEVEDENEEDDEDDDEDEDEDDKIDGRQSIGRDRKTRSAHGQFTLRTSRDSVRASSNRRGANMAGDRVSTSSDRSNRRGPNMVGDRVPTPSASLNRRGPNMAGDRVHSPSDRSNRRGPNMVGDRVPTPSASSNRRGPNRAGDRVYSPSDRSNRRGSKMEGDWVPTSPPRRNDSRKGYNSDVRSPGRRDNSRARGRSSTERANSHY